MRSKRHYEEMRMMSVDAKRLNDGAGRVWVAPDTGEIIDITYAWQKSDARIALRRREQAMLAAAGQTGPEARWYVLRVDNGMDKAVDKALSDANVERWMPVTEIGATWRGGRKGPRGCSKIVPVLPGYILIHVVSCAPAWAALSTIKGVRGVLGGAYAPAPISDDKVLKLRAFVERDPVAIDVLTKALKAGDTVRVTDGPFASFPGIVEEVLEKGRALVEVMIFGRATPVDLDLAQITKLD
jgi:transcription antitermination factor NusG